MMNWQITVLVVLVGCGGSGSGSDGGSDGDGGGGGSQDATTNGFDSVSASDAVDVDAFPIPKGCQSGHITYGAGGQLYRRSLATGTTTNLTNAFNALATGSDEWVATSPDGQWLLLSTNRFEASCNGWACLAIVSSDLSSGQTLRADGAVVHASRYSAIASGGQRVVYPLNDGPHTLDLFVTNKSGPSWSAGVLITADSPYDYNAQPAISADGSTVVFDCGPDPYGQAPTKICEVGTDGSGFRVVWTPEQGAGAQPGSANASLHHADYFPDGSIIFEASWSGEQVWRLIGGGPPTLIAPTYSNDNSPCALPNGCIISLWLERPGGSGLHEIKTMTADGDNVAMIVTDIDVADTGLGCSQ